MDKMDSNSTLSPSFSPTFSPSNITTEDFEDGIPIAPLKKFEYALMLWYSAFMFVVSGTLFITTSIQKWRNASPVIIHWLDVASYASLYFAFAITLVVYNKWLISVWEGGFSFPLLMTMVHMVLKMTMSWFVVRGCRSNDEIPKVSRWTYYLYACPVGATTGLDVAASNASLFYISVTLYTVIKASSLVFVFLFSILYGLQSCSIKLIAVTCVIFGGVLMASYDDTKFDAIGFSLVLVASATGGYRWALTEVLMSRIGTKMNSLMTIYTISPASVLVLIPFVLWLEFGTFLNSKFYQEPGLFILVILNVCGSGMFAFAMIYVELAVLNRTSSLSLVVIGYFKQMAQIIVSVIVFHEVLSPLNIFGVIVTFLGMGLYARVKHFAAANHGAKPMSIKSRKRNAVVHARETDDSNTPFAQNEGDIHVMDTTFEDISLDHEYTPDHEALTDYDPDIDREDAPISKSTTPSMTTYQTTNLLPATQEQSSKKSSDSSTSKRSTTSTKLRKDQTDFEMVALEET